MTLLSSLQDNNNNTIEAPTPPAELEKAFLATTYCVHHDNSLLRIRPGMLSKHLDELLKRIGAESWAFITASNPGCRALSDEENRVRHSELRKAVLKLGFTCLNGYGLGDSGDWPAEESLLVVNATQELALLLGEQFGQLAVIYGRVGEVSRLLWTSLTPAEE
jgi:Protein of unknown function (DUF3293)